MVYWSRSRQELWRKGDTSGDCQTVREAYYDCDGDTLLFKVDPARPRRLPHRGAQLLLHAARRDLDRRLIDLDVRPSRDEFRSARRGAHGRPGVDRAARRPGDTGGRLRQARRRR